MKLLLVLVLPLFLMSCNQKKDVSKTPQIHNVSSNENNEGKKLLETHCYACHNPTAPEDSGRIAPPMVAIKAHYLTPGISKEKFVAQITAFTAHPSQANAKMRGAVNRFGVMPAQHFPEGVVAQIASYMYDYQIEEPEWFNSHRKQNGFGNFVQTGKKSNAAAISQTDAEMGLNYALLAKNVLGKNLMEAIQQKGTLHALEFCNLKAIPLTDSIATKHHISIKRVSDKNRNPANQANAEEIAIIEKYKNNVAANQEPQPTLIKNGNVVQFYYPIITNSMCLQCHGTSENIKSEVRVKTLKLYPKDLAVGYSENQVRGIWNIVFDTNRK